MTKMQVYSKGEWTIQELPHDFGFRKGHCYAIRDKRNCCLATVGEVDAIFDGEESEANARLIAAAPEMYEALKQAIAILNTSKGSHFVKQDTGYVDVYYVEHMEVYENIARAILRAEGK